MTPPGNPQWTFRAAEDMQIQAIATALADRKTRLTPLRSWVSALRR
jgi:ribosomal protein L20